MILGNGETLRLGNGERLLGNGDRLLGNGGWGNGDGGNATLGER